MICKINNCSAKVRGHGYCGKHYMRWYRYGSPDIFKKARGDAIGYSAMHERLKRILGKADEYLCLFCDTQAEEWAYNYLDEDEGEQTIHGYLMRFSINLQYYMPLCVNCHKNYDRGERQLLEAGI